jgi:hypothetical protein
VFKAVADTNLRRRDAGHVFDWHEELPLTDAQEAARSDLEKANLTLFLVNEQGTDMADVFAVGVEDFAVPDVLTEIQKRQVGVAELDELIAAVIGAPLSGNQGTFG